MNATSGNQHGVAPDSTAVRVALWRAAHVQIDPPPYIAAAALRFCQQERIEPALGTIPPGSGVTISRWSAMCKNYSIDGNSSSSCEVSVSLRSAREKWAPAAITCASSPSPRNTSGVRKLRLRERIPRHIGATLNQHRRNPLLVKQERER
jgi:hypothetical protein